MKANELLKRIIAAGADEKGIRDRFGENEELYEMCLRDFIDEPGFVLLRDTVNAQDYKKAFEAAHALKGLSGNLGVTDLYNVVRKLTNSLRNAEYARVEEEYKQVEKQYERLRRIVLNEPVPEAAPVKQPSAAQKNSILAKIRGVLGNKNNRLFAYLLCSAVVIVVAVGLLFLKINNLHNTKVVQESGQHLVEISNQIKLYIEESIETDWRIARSVGDSIVSSAFADDDVAIFEMIQKKQAVWGASDLMLYTQNGYCIYADGSAETTDLASMNVYHAREKGKWMSVLDSKLIYTVPLETELTFKGSEIVAVSVVRDMSSFLDEMDFSSFGGNAWMYLSEKDGVLISSLSSPYTVQSFNIQAVIGEMDIMPLDKNCSPEHFLVCLDTEVFTLSGKSEKLYGVSTPVLTGAEPMKLFYFVPENVVNNIMGGFANQLLLFSMAIVLLFGVIALAASLIVYKSRKKMFDKAMLNRERMFDLLIRNTKTAFGLFSVNSNQPEYVSANAAEVTGDSYWTLDRTDDGFRIRNELSIETENIARVNEMLREWDGKHPFRSGYLCNNSGASPTYFIFELYPVDDSTSDFVGIAQDVTPVYAREEAVRSAMENAKQANEAKTRFLSSMSHDIRTPMNAIINMSNFALESIDQPKKLGNYLRVIRESAEHLLHLINDVLDMSRIESGRLVIASAPFDIKKEIHRQAEMIRPMCKTKNQTFMTDLDGLGEAVVSGDALKLSQIVVNLLSNAMKFTPEKGAIRLIAKQIPSPRDSVVAVQLSVEDNGIGIPEPDLKRIFEPFSRSDDEAVSQIEGTGLGLAIVKNYVEAMGGTIRCESELGEGSTFIVELLFQKADTSVDRIKQEAALTDGSFLGMHALVAEDNRTNQLIAKEILERMGFIADFVNDGSEALQRFGESKPDTYDVIFMDIQMPVMDGYTATEQIRQSDHPQAKTIPIIAMTANAFAEDIEKARAIGMDGYVDKPVVPLKLAEETKTAIRNRKGRA